MPIDNNMFVGRKKKTRKKYSETISKCLKSRHVYMECMKHTKKEERRKGQTVHSVILLVSKLDQEQKEEPERGASQWH